MYRSPRAYKDGGEGRSGVNKTAITHITRDSAWGPGNTIVGAVTKGVRQGGQQNRIRRTRLWGPGNDTLCMQYRGLGVQIIHTKSRPRRLGPEMEESSRVWGKGIVRLCVGPRTSRLQCSTTRRCRARLRCPEMARYGRNDK